MAFPERFSKLPAYAFPRLRALLDGHAPGAEPIAMSIGEPRHPFPDFVAPALAEAIGGFAKYPANEGAPELLDAIAGAVRRRYGVEIGPERILALNGTREGLFTAALALCPEPAGGQRPAVLMPNPFYQVYAAGALAAGAEPVFLPATAATGQLPDFDAVPADILARTALVYLCSPANPQGAVASRDYWSRLLRLAEQYDFRVIADECYGDIYRDAPPPGVLEVAAADGADPERVLSFQSLSKRSNVPGLRSGFVAGGVECIRRMRQLRAYGGAPLSPPLQAVSAQLWNDDKHVADNRALYAEKYAIAEEILGDVPGVTIPQAGFFLWLPVKDDEDAALRLWREAGLRTLPGRYLSRAVEGQDPGRGHLRVALVAPRDEVRQGLARLRAVLYDGEGT